MSSRRPIGLRLCLRKVAACGILLCLSGGWPPVAQAAAWTTSESRELVQRMETAYAAVSDYQTRLIISGFGAESQFQNRQTLVYTFKKPRRIRLDFESPNRGMLVIYPDRDGKVLVRPGYWGTLFSFHLDRRSSLLEISPGQQIDQTDLGLLIHNISLSLTDLFRGELDIQKKPEAVVITVLSDNPFRRGDTTRYAFTIDTRQWLPVQVKEMSAQGKLRRTVDYTELRLNTGVPDSFFRADARATRW